MIQYLSFCLFLSLHVWVGVGGGLHVHACGAQRTALSVILHDLPPAFFETGSFIGLKLAE